MTRTLCVGKPNLPDKEEFLRLVDTIWDSKWLTNNGPLVQRFEKEVAAFLGVRFCVAVSNATVGLQVVARSLNLRGEIIVPSFTFISTAGAFAWLGLTPVFCDIDSDTWCLDPECAERLITERTTAIVGVHLFGRPCVPDLLERLAREYHLELIFDAAHAFGCTYKNRNVGDFGTCEVFSFHATKFINSFEGGMITTNNVALARNLRLCRNFGFTGEDETSLLGTNAKMSEVHAAMGLVSLRSINKIREVNSRNYRCYEAELKGIPGIDLRPGDRNYQYVVLEVSEGRDQLHEALKTSGILARRYFYPGCHRMFPFLTSQFRLPVTECISERVLCLPTGTDIAPTDIERICKIIRDVRN